MGEGIIGGTVREGSEAALMQQRLDSTIKRIVDRSGDPELSDSNRARTIATFFGKIADLRSISPGGLNGSEEKERLSKERDTAYNNILSDSATKEAYETLINASKHLRKDEKPGTWLSEVYSMPPDALREIANKINFFMQNRRPSAPLSDI